MLSTICPEIKCQLYLPLVYSLFIPFESFPFSVKKLFNISSWKVNSWLSRPGCLKSRNILRNSVLGTALLTLQRDEL